MNRLAVAMLCLLAGLSAAAAQEPAPGLYDRPVLVLEPGMHMAAIWRADVDREGRFAVTGSHDKTVRIWSLADGRLQRTIRLPAGPGNVGKVNAVAISPDGALVAAGGWLGDVSTLGSQQIYLFDRASGKMVARLQGLPSSVYHLTFSPDGRYLAATLYGGNGLRVYAHETGGWTETASDPDYGDHSFGAAFAADGRLATTSLDGQVRLYDVAFHLVAKVAPPGGQRPFGIAFSPDGSRLAVGYDDTTSVDLLDGHSLAPLPGPDTTGIDNGDVSEVAWSADGATLYAAGRYDAGGPNPVVAWADAEAGPRRELAAANNSVMTLRPLAGGDLLVAAADPYLARLGPDGAVRWQQRPKQADLRGQDKFFAVSADGQQADFGYQPWGKAPARFDLTHLTLRPDPPADEVTAPPRQSGLPVANWNSTAPTLADAPLALKRYEQSRSLAIHPDGKSFVLGADWTLRTYAADGRLLWQRAVPGEVWAVNITGDGRLVVAGYGDGTIRWHQTSDGKELLAFLPLADRKRWVVWTPEGYYAASPGTAEVLGWHVNRGWDKPAEFYPITSYGGFYQERALPLVLQELNTARALGIAKIAYDRSVVQELTHSPAPPGAQLHVLAIGVSEYANAPHLALDFADDDAREIAKALLDQEGGLYAKVNMQHLADGAASRKAVFAGLQTLQRTMQPGQQDVALIHFSGHGAEIDGTYYLLPADAEAGDPFAIETTGIEIGQFKRALERLGERGKVLVLLDACRSGNLTSGSKDGLRSDIEAVRAELAAAGTGVVVLTPSSGREISRESPDWKHGAFTKAVLEALDGKAEADGDTWLSVSEIEGYIVRRVRELTANQQNPRISVLGEHHFESRLFVTR